MRKLRRYIPSGNLLYVFDAAARLESTKAAEELNVTPAAVSHAIRQLEQGLGLPLFHRRHRQLILNSEGLKLRDSITSGLNHVEDTVEELRASLTSTVIKVYAPIAAGSYWFLPRLNQYPDETTRIEMQLYNSDRNLQLPADGASFAITNGRVDWSGHETRKFAREIITPVCSPSYLEKHGPIRLAQDLLGHPLLHLDANYHEGIVWNDFLGFFGVEPGSGQTGVTYNNYILVMQAALTGAGIALGWQHSTDELIKSGSLVRALDVAVDSGEHFWVVHRSERDLSPRAKAVRDWFIAMRQAEDAALDSDTTRHLKASRHIT
ncbi:LysR substrate-binding domain-containing protein [Paracoccus aerius]|uniref:LysR substrate-binding domain-containing protein n=1 Tax=Paracoccus aerius TaxID=1915382 RepID=UPI003615DB93